MTDNNSLPELTEVKSSHLKAVGYAEGKLYVRFVNGLVYAYTDVPETEFKHILGAVSAGKTFHQRIKGKYKENIVEFPV